jgi:hypothetical protein
MSPLPNICLVMVTPESSEVRWVAAVPKAGDRIHGRHPGTWVVVEDVYPSGTATYTVFASSATEGRFDQALERAVDAAERLQVVVSPTPRHRSCRDGCGTISRSRHRKRVGSLATLRFVAAPEEAAGERLPQPTSRYARGDRG